MSVYESVKRFFTGNYFSQEFLCVEVENFSNPLHYFLKHDSGKITDITSQLIFIGYKPLLAALCFNEITNTELKNIPQQVNFFLSENSNAKPVAHVTMKSIENFKFNNTTVLILEGISANNNYSNIIQQKCNSLLRLKRRNKKDEADLSWDEYKQLLILYSYPRPISLISLGNKNEYNIFPTDLNGRINEKTFCISLRKNGLAALQTEQHKKICMMKMDIAFYKEVYELRKNHMHSLTSSSALNLQFELSEKFNLPLHKGTLSYLELALSSKTSHGIHNIYFFDIVNEKTVDAKTKSIAHLHREYANYRMRKGFDTKYFLR